MSLAPGSPEGAAGPPQVPSLPLSGVDFLADVLAGLSHRPRSIPCKWLYDAEGSRLFEEICELPEYDLTRTELAILNEACGEVAAWVGPRAYVVEPGVGAGSKTRLLLERLTDPVAYAPIDISPCALAEGALALAAAFPTVEVLPLCADFHGVLDLPTPSRRATRTLVFFPGSTIGNLEPDAAAALLGRLRRQAGEGGALLLGVDLVKPAAELEAAYDDAAGVTAAFNLNLLRRINRELGGDFRPAAFAHRAVWNAPASRVEMHLESLLDQTVTVAGRSIELAEGETIETERSYKYTLPGALDLGRRAGYRPVRDWTDRAGRFAVLLLASDEGMRRVER